MSRWRSASITVKLTCLFAAIACAALVMVGLSLYDATRAALSRRADFQLIARVEHMRTLLHDLYTVKELEARPALFETMMGDEQDVIVFRRPGMPPFINVNPEHIPLPAIIPVPAERQVTLKDLLEGQRKDGFRMRWVSAQGHVGPNGEFVQIIAAHVMTQEERILLLYRNRVMITVLAAVVIVGLLAFWALRSGLRPLREMADRTSEITPEQLSIRLDVSAVPRELQQLALSFNAMLDRLANGYERLVQFSADLAHELRTPIGVLIGQTQVTLARERDVGEYRQVLESNLEELERLARIAQNILFLAQADHKSVAIERSTLPIHDELEMIQSYFEGVADERDLHFELEATGLMDVNPIMCRRAISNVVVNAVRYALPNTTIRLSAVQLADAAMITVGNRGNPIPEEHLPKLFDRFYRGDASRSEYTESSGLGLAIVRAIMVLHDGTAEMTCTPDGWVEVKLTFPSNTRK